jgi:peptidoglycan/LPS O-acetylase OafA/YrhL
MNIKNDKPVSREQWAILAGIRFFLALIVLCFHAEGFGHSENVSSFLAKTGGDTAVIFFFVVSGYSIASSVETAPRQFLIRRMIRLAPAYSLGIALAITSTFVASGMKVDTWYVHHYSLLAWIQNIFCLQGITTETIKTNGPVWSLGCEAFYYLLAPLIAKLDTKNLSTMTIYMMIVSLVLPNFTKMSPSAGMFGFAHVSLFWVWLMGYLAYRVRDKANVMFFLFSMFAFVYSYAEKSLVLCASIFGSFFTQKITLSEISMKYLNILGDLSYVVYILHYPMLILFNRFVSSDSPFNEGAGCIIVICAICYAICMFYDRPVRMKLKSMILS